MLFDWWEALPTRPSVPFVGWVGFTEVIVAASFLAPTWIAISAVANGWNPLLQFVAIMLAGAIQGFLVAFVHWAFLVRARTVPPLLAWLGLSSMASALAWGVAQLPTLLPRSTPASITTLLTLASIAIALALPNVAQWYALRPVSSRARLFAAVSYAAWLVGAGIMAGTVSILAHVNNLAATIILLIGGAYAGVLVVSVGTWIAARWLTMSQPKKSPPAKKKSAVVKRVAPSSASHKRK